MNNPQYSISPTGEKFLLPGAGQFKSEFARLKKLAAAQRREGREIVVVVGVGFVGAVMAAVIAECARVLKPGAPLFMVNDNVRYAGASISVDIIPSEIARQLGFAVESILVLPGGKGNSSQQMGLHGREALRKCVYVWRKR